jgi:hypothetical protein
VVETIQPAYCRLYRLLSGRSILRLKLSVRPTTEPSVKEILAEGKFTVPPFLWSRDEYLGCKTTKYPKERATKRRELLVAVG